MRCLRCSFSKPKGSPDLTMITDIWKSASWISPFPLFMSRNLCAQCKSICSSEEVDTNLFILPYAVTNSFDELHINVVVYFAGPIGMPNVPVANTLKHSIFLQLHSTKLIDAARLTAHRFKATHLKEQCLDERLPKHIRLQRGT